MIKAVIIEDEELSTVELVSGLKEVAPEIDVVAVARSVNDGVTILKSVEYDLIFMDIHLGDGSSFEIFDRVLIKSPVIFITAYDAYALKAFQNQGIDYLLKPFSREDLQRAIDKLKQVSHTGIEFDKLYNISNLQQPYRERFLVGGGEKIRSILIEDVAYFMADGKYLHLITDAGNDYLIDDTLNGISEAVDPDQFFRINRKFIISFKSISEMVRYSGNRIKVTLKPAPSQDIDTIVSGDRVQEFKNWLNK